MVNLEWCRTFKSVYKKRNFSLAAKELFYQSASCKSADINARGTLVINCLIENPGVEPTEYAKLLNNLIIEALDRLENVENGFRAKALKRYEANSVGISKPYSVVWEFLLSKFDYIDFSFHENEILFELVNTQKIKFCGSDKV
jgi:hypothetical protein